MRSYCILCSSRTPRWYQISDIANGRQADLIACLSKSIYMRKLLSSSTHFTPIACVNLDTPQDQVSYTSKDDGKFEANVHAIRFIDQATYGSGDRCCVPIDSEYLSKTKTSAYQTNHHRHYRSPAKWKFTGHIPI